MTEVSEYQPQKPFLMMNRYYIWRHDDDLWNLPAKGMVGKIALENMKFVEHATTIDLNCRKFDVAGIDKIGLWWPSKLRFIFARDLIKIRYLYSEPIQLTFESAREEIIDHVITHRWAGQTGATPKQWREMHTKYQTMSELTENISFYGRDMY